MKTVLLLLSALLLAVTGAGAESVAELAKKLLGADDFRVRMQAALALGATASKEAVTPLCKGLDDGTDSVRAAAAAGLGKLRLGGVDCLEARAKKEKDRNVQKMIAKAIGLVKEALNGPAVTAGTKLYLAIGSAGGDHDGVVRSAMVAAKPAHSVIAPEGETAAQAKKLFVRFPNLSGYFLSPALGVTYGGGRLTVKLDLTLYGYPDKQEQGSLSRTAGMSGVGSKDAAKEKQLIEKVAREAMGEFAKLASQVD